MFICGDTMRVRRVDASTGIITTVAGIGVADFSGDGGLAISAALSFPEGVAVDASGNLYIADRGNHRVRKVDAVTGIITTFSGAGTAGSSGDGGPATEATLNAPSRVVVGPSGDVFISEGNSVRKVNVSTGIITRVAGTGAGGLSGDGGLATSAAMDFPNGVAFDAMANMFIADTSNQRIRKVDAATGIISTVAGSGATGFNNGNYSGDGGPATKATFNRPRDVAVDASGNLFIVDELNHRIRRADSIAEPISTPTPTQPVPTPSTATTAQSGAEPQHSFQSYSARAQIHDRPRPSQTIELAERPGMASSMLEAACARGGAPAQWGAPADAVPFATLFGGPE